MNSHPQWDDFLVATPEELPKAEWATQCCVDTPDYCQLSLDVLSGIAIPIVPIGPFIASQEYFVAAPAELCPWTQPQLIPLRDVVDPSVASSDGHVSACVIVPLTFEATAALVPFTGQGQGPVFSPDGRWPLGPALANLEMPKVCPAPLLGVEAVTPTVYSRSPPELDRALLEGVSKYSWAGFEAVHWPVAEPGGEPGGGTSAGEPDAGPSDRDAADIPPKPGRGSGARAASNSGGKRQGASPKQGLLMLILARLETIENQQTALLTRVNTLETTPSPGPSAAPGPNASTGLFGAWTPSGGMPSPPKEGALARAAALVGPPPMQRHQLAQTRPPLPRPGHPELEEAVAARQHALVEMEGSAEARPMLSLFEHSLRTQDLLTQLLPFGKKNPLWMPRSGS